jgi:2-amino-4-hydroxy-6-hydroxymethyldihydropteridine diphosphokinase
MVVCYLGVGSNLGDRKANIEKAVNSLRKIKKIKIDKVSKFYEASPQGGPRQGKFLNGAIRLRTALEPSLLLKKIKSIEKKLGRKKTVRYGPRIIDLDILLYADRIINKKNLKIPHPRMFEREFVLKPLIEIV